MTDGDRCATTGCMNAAPDGERCAECRDATPGGDSPDVNPTPDAGETGSRAAEIGLDAAPAIASDEFPDEIGDRWHAWKPEVSFSDGERSERKVPRAPWLTGGSAFVSAQDADVWTDHETVREWIDTLPGYGLAVNIRDRDEYPDESLVLVDYDDARDPETGRVHPTVREHVERAGSYADVSTSGTGVHILVRGALPDGVKSVDAALPAREGFPDAEIEVYDSSRFVAMTGERLAATPADVRDAPAFVDELADEFATVPEGTPDELVREPEKSAAEIADVDTTDDPQDVYDAIQHTGPADIRLRSTVTHERGDGSKSLDPSWADSASGTRLAQVGDGWVYRKGMRGLDALQVVALEERIIHSPDEYPDGDEFREAVDALRERGAHVPELDGSGESEPVSALPLAQLDALSPQERRQAAERRGVEWPDTDDARERLFKTITQVMHHKDSRVIDAPTSLGKSYAIAATPWSAAQYDSTTGERPVVHLSKTRDARDEAVRTAEEHGGGCFTLRGRHEACPIAAGDHDPEPELQAEAPTFETDYQHPDHDEREAIESGELSRQEYDERERERMQREAKREREWERQTDEERRRERERERDDDRAIVTVDGQPASEWIDVQCESKGIPFSVAHTRLKSRMDQNGDLPCCAAGQRCRAIAQWEDLREGDHALIEATHNFARVPSLRNRTNLAFDEEPDFAEDLSTDRVRRMVTALLQEIDAPVSTWEAFIGLVRMDGYGGDAGREADQLGHALDDASPDRDWYFDEPNAHTLAPAIARAIFYGEERGNGRWGATSSHEPPRLDAEAGDGDGWNREWVRVVLDESNEVRTVRTSPDLNLCRSVIGLDAHPSMPKWQVNTKPEIETKEVLNTTERQLWRRYERGLRVVQAGGSTRPFASGEYFNGDGTAAMIEHLRAEYGREFSTVITAASVEERTQEIMRDGGISDPETMHYGEEKSRNDFANESVGLVNGSIDPGDDHIINLLAELDLDAEPETTIDDDGEEHRAHGRGFVGPDAETADEILASVRENHVAQSAGRYARDPDDPEATATVIVRTDATPTGFADVQVPGVEWVYSDRQRDVVEALRERERPASAKEIASETDVSKRHVGRTLKRLAENSTVQRFEGEGDWGADLYAETGLPTTGVVSTGEEGSRRIAYEESNTWSVSILSPTRTHHSREESDEREQDDRGEWWAGDRRNPAD